MAEAPPQWQVIDRAYDLVTWSCRHLAKFPRGLRCTLGDALERRLYLVLENLIRARYDSRGRVPLLRQTNRELELLRFQYRLAKDLRCLSVDSYGFAARAVNEVGQMVGGWLKAQAQVTPQTGPPRAPGPEGPG
jgi:hypothetical protein